MLVTTPNTLSCGYRRAATRCAFVLASAIGTAFVFPPTVGAQDAPRARPQARAVRVVAGAIRVDGTLGEAAWQLAPPVTEFLQREPSEGEPPRDPMEVHFAYDDTSVVRWREDAQPRWRSGPIEPAGR